MRFLKAILSILALSFLMGCVTSGTGTLEVRVTTLDDRPVPHVHIRIHTQSGELVETCLGDDAGFATILLSAGSYVLEATSMGFRSCGPEGVNIRSDRPTAVHLLLRVCAYVDGFIVFECDTPPCREPIGYSEYHCGPCPDKPEVPESYDFFPPEFKPRENPSERNSSVSLQFSLLETQQRSIEETGDIGNKKTRDMGFTIMPNTSFQRTLTRGGFGPLNSNR
jgi:hypothetical protein